MSEDQEEEKPPLFRTWATWYGLILSLLALEVILFFYISGKFS